jgi:hypothetical protein
VTDDDVAARRIRSGAAPRSDPEIEALLVVDDLDGLCDEALQPEPLADDDVDGIVLFADLAGTTDLEEIEYRQMEWAALFGDDRAS